MKKPTTFTLFSIIFILVLIVGALFAWQYWSATDASQLISKNKAEEIVTSILEADEEKEDIVAYLYPDVLKKGTLISSWDTQVSTTTLKSETYLAWIDRDPGNAFFAHETQFIYIDAAGGDYRIEEQEYWPQINSEPFEGDEKSMIAAESAGDVSAWILEMQHRLSLNIKDWLASAAQAQGAGNKLRIDPEPENAPPGEYYALIVSGFGKNAWVFLDGGHQMYTALKGVGYDDAHINFLGSAPAALDPAWNRQGEAQLVRSTLVNDAASPAVVEDAIKSITARMTERDSLFVFMLAHGARNTFALGKPVGRNTAKNADLNTILKGQSADFRSIKFADTLLRGDYKACEVMLLIDSCHAGTHEAPLRAAYDPHRVKRLAVGHSTNERTKSFGADYRKPWQLNRRAKEDLDNAARRTPTEDPNKSDHGGEFSSGFIANVNQTIFASVYTAGVALDAAEKNNMTEPYSWGLGETGPCTTAIPDIAPPLPPEPPLTDPEPEPGDEPEPEPQGARSTNIDFEHVVPGEYSEVYLWITTEPGTSVSATLTGPGVTSAPSQTITADTGGKALFTWRINLYGSYTTNGSVNGVVFSESVIVN